MIGKGNHHAHGVKLAAYLMKGHPGERAELIEMRGFGPVSDLHDGFRIEHMRARDGTRAEKPFFHVQLRGAHGEGLTLTTAQQLEIADRCDKALGLAGQPRAASLHINRQTGDRHLHIGYSLVAEGEDGRLFVKKVGLYKNKLKRLSREIERDYGLKIVSSERNPGQARAADRKELEQSRRLDTDGPAIRAAILNCLEQSDGGKAFKAALDAQGLMLANGDRRDCFVVVDQAGGHHALNKALTGQTLAETRARLSDLDRSQLPGVTQAQALQAERHATPEQQQPPDREAAPPSLTRMYRGIGSNVWEAQSGDALFFSTDPARAAAFGQLHYVDVTAEELAKFERPHSKRILEAEPIAVNDWRTADPAIIARLRPLEAERHRAPETAQEARQQPEPQPDRETRAGAETAAQPPEKRRLGKTAAQINAAWTESRNASDPAAAFRQAIEDRGPILVYVAADQAKASERAKSFAKAVNRQNRPLREGFAVVDQRGTVTRIDERTTGDTRAEIEARLASIDRTKLLTVAEARDVMKEANKAAWRAERQAEREQARPASWIEKRIAECADQAQRAGAVTQQDAQGRTVSGAETLAERLRPEDERTHAARTVHGPDAFAARLEEAGIALARVTEANLPQLDALRRAEEIARMTAETNGEAYKGHRLADLKAGQLVAVTRSGDVYRINPDKLRGADIPAALPGVIEAREAFEIERADKTTLWDLKRAEIEAGRRQRTEARQLHRGAATAERAVHTAFETPASAVGKTLRKTGKLAKAVEKVFETAFGLLFGAFMAGPKDTQAQAEQKEKAATNEETLHARDYAAHVQAKEAEFDEQMHAQKTADQQQDLRSSQRSGRPATREANIGRGRDDDYERERER
jgi:hypothetical protein